MKPIRELMQELRRLGYYDFQIKEIVREAVGNKRLEDLSPAEAQDLAARLEEAVAFARRCLSLGQAEKR